MTEPEPKQRKFDSAHYPIVIRQTGPAVRAINYDFRIEITEYPATDETEAILQIARLVQTVRIRISERLGSLDRASKNHPTPLPTEEILSPQAKDGISVQEAARLLGEAPHTIRRMADDGELSVKRTRKGHRRFSRKEIEAMLLRQGLLE